jgi:hypothetical protein
MCLTVTHVPEHKDACLVLQGIKLLEKYAWSTRWTTPFQHTTVPTDGWLLPTRPSKRTYFPPDHPILAGFIHYHAELKDTSYLGGRERLTCWAIDTRAFQNYEYHDSRDEGICLGLYLPHCDVMSTKRDKGKLITQLERHSHDPDRKQLAKAHPTLKRILFPGSK